MSSGMVLYNTATRNKEPFQPADANHVKMYVCGPTVYNLIHIGNARPIVVFDTLFRVLQSLFPKVSYARNITDIDDKIMAAAKEEGKPVADIAAQYTREFESDVGDLGTLPPSMAPRATDHIEPMLNMISTLIEKQHAYVAEGHVLFAVQSMADYGALSGRDLDSMLDGARVEVAPYKRYAGDFVLWKPSENDQPGWPSPWGRGRPGWHIECSAMIAAHLGPEIDIHGGGRDLIFPHHENERAQSCCAQNEGSFVRYWVHNGYINLDGEKMSKSLGNFRTLRSILSAYRGEVVRYALLSAHYRSELDFSEALLEQSKASLDSLYGALRGIDISGSDADQNDIRENPVYQALLDDINTPEALSQLHSQCRELNQMPAGAAKSRLAQQIKNCGAFVGLLQWEAERWFQESSNADELSADQIAQYIEQRQQAKNNKDYARSDEIRAQLLSKGVVLEDTREGVRWKRA